MAPEKTTGHWALGTCRMSPPGLQALAPVTQEAQGLPKCSLFFMRMAVLVPTSASPQ